MKKRLIHNFSVNVLQLILNQFFGLIAFYLLSTGLDKTNFGEINLALAVLLAVFNILSFGIDQLVIKKIASGADVQTILSLYLGHVLIAGFLFYAVLFPGKILFPHLDAYNLILLLGIGKLMIFLSTPFKQISSGMERFRELAYMSVVSNFVRCVALLVFALFRTLTVSSIIMVFIAGDLSELLVSILLFKYAVKSNIHFKWDKTAYLNLLHESLPQTGIVVITSALARFDWIFIGFILSAVKLAEYSFAYKVFEISTLPLLAIAPLLIPRFTKMVQQKLPVENLKFLIRVEIAIAVLVALLLNLGWSPVIDSITTGKYGTVNITTIFLLSLCMPLLYINNFLWTIYFTQGKLKMILTSFIVTLMVNVTGDVILIPFYKNEGAAFAFFLSCLAQTVFYLKKNEINELSSIWATLLISTICALCSGFICQNCGLKVWLMLPLSAILFIMLLIITRQLKPSDKTNLKELLNW